MRESVPRPGHREVRLGGRDGRAAHYCVRLDTGEGLRAQRVARRDLGALARTEEEPRSREFGCRGARVLGEDAPGSPGECRGKQFAGTARRVKDRGAVANPGEADHAIGDPGRRDGNTGHLRVPVEQVIENSHRAYIVDRAFHEPCQAAGHAGRQCSPVAQSRGNRRGVADGFAQGGALCPVADFPPNPGSGGKFPQAGGSEPFLHFRPLVDSATAGARGRSGKVIATMAPGQHRPSGYTRQPCNLRGIQHGLVCHDGLVVPVSDGRLFGSDNYRLLPKVFPFQ